MLFAYVSQQHANGVQLVVTYIVSGLASQVVCFTVVKIPLTVTAMGLPVPYKLLYYRL